MFLSDIHEIITHYIHLIYCHNVYLSLCDPEFCMGYIDEDWYVGSDGHKYYPCGLSSPNAHI